MSIIARSSICSRSRIIYRTLAYRTVARRQLRRAHSCSAQVWSLGGTLEWCAEIPCAVPNRARSHCSRAWHGPHLSKRRHGMSSFQRPQARPYPHDHIIINHHASLSSRTWHLFSISSGAPVQYSRISPMVQRVRPHRRPLSAPPPISSHPNPHPSLSPSAVTASHGVPLTAAAAALPTTAAAVVRGTGASRAVDTEQPLDRLAADGALLAPLETAHARGDVAARDDGGVRLGGHADRAEQRVRSGGRLGGGASCDIKGMLRRAAARSA